MKEIKIGNGGAGITGFVQYLCNEFNISNKTNYTFKWITSDTTETINGLINGDLDVGWPYGKKTVCDAYSKHSDTWTEPTYIFRDHFVLVGPKHNPADIPFSGDAHPHVSKDKVYAIFKAISEGKNGSKFMTRNDQSATNILEQNIFHHVLGRLPNIHKDSWYIPFKSYPDMALKESNNNGYYTLSDRGIWTWADPNYKTELCIYCEGGDSDPLDILLNPCFTIARKDSKEAVAFCEWLGKEGQNYVEKYKLNGENLYSKAPDSRASPCEKE
jgi:ABC-type tungstate transport system permease subunit